MLRVSVHRAARIDQGADDLDAQVPVPVVGLGGGRFGAVSVTSIALDRVSLRLRAGRREPVDRARLAG